MDSYTGYCRTRSKKKYSPYAVDTNAGNEQFNLETALMSAVVSEADVNCDNTSVWTDGGVEAAPDSPLPPPHSAGNEGGSPSGTTVFPECQTPLLALPAVPAESKAGTTLSPGKKRRRQLKKEQGHSNRKRARAAAKDEDHVLQHAASSVRPNVAARYTNEGPWVRCSTATAQSKVSSTGFIGLNDKKDPQARREYGLAEVTGENSELKFELKEWDGHTPSVIVDKTGRVIAVLAGHPDDQDWASVHREAAEVLEKKRSSCNFSTEMLQHRRGGFAALSCGISFGGGQRRPMNLAHNLSNKAVADELCGMSCFERIAGFGSAVLKHRAPQIYNHYVDNLAELYRKPGQSDPDGVQDDEEGDALKRPFSSSVFCACTFNFGPRTVCLKHKDFANLAYGWCAITSLGTFDYKKGGHLILWDCHLVIEFPPGSTILLPSAVIAHSNTSICPGEHRYSFAQYTSGGLFRWAKNGCQTTAKCEAAMTDEEKLARAKEDAERWSLGLSLWPRVNFQSQK